MSNKLALVDGVWQLLVVYLSFLDSRKVAAYDS